MTPPEAANAPSVGALPFLLLSTLLTHYDLGYFSVDSTLSSLDRWLIMLCKVTVFPIYLIVGEIARDASSSLLRCVLLKALFFLVSALAYVFISRAVFPTYTVALGELSRDASHWINILGTIAICLC